MNGLNICTCVLRRGKREKERERENEREREKERGRASEKEKKREIFHSILDCPKSEPFLIGYVSAFEPQRCDLNQFFTLIPAENQCIMKLFTEKNMKLNLSEISGKST